jgi:acyl-CoA synthetase (AMP-forming)/AMP-acid ligase II
MTTDDSGLNTLALDASAMTVAGWFATQVALRGDAIALQENDRRLSYRALNARVNQLASRLLAVGLTRGDRVAILSENRCEFVEVELAAAKLGVITACQNWRQADAELTHGIHLAEPKLIIVSERYAAT